MMTFSPSNILVNQKKGRKAAIRKQGKEEPPSLHHSPPPSFVGT
jgi:hypothetical protein